MRRGPSGLACPTHVLFNGGVLNAAMVRERITGALDAWLAEEGMDPVKPLAGEDLMHAVSRGAAYYGLSRRGGGVRIRGGVPRTYYVGIESSMPSVPGFAAPFKALTVVPFGMEEGTEARISGREFGLVVGAPAEFRFFTSTVRKDDKPGDLIEDFGEELAGAIAHGSEFSGRRERRRGDAGLVRKRGHRDRRAAALVRGARRAAVEAGVQREREGGMNRLEELRRRHAAAEQGGGAERQARQHAEGRLSARERIELLLDEGIVRRDGQAGHPPVPRFRHGRADGSGRRLRHRLRAHRRAPGLRVRAGLHGASAGRFPRPTRRRSARLWTWR